MDSLDKIIAKVSTIPSKPASNVVFWLLLLLVLYLAAQLTWKLLPVDSPVVAWKPAAVAVASGGNNVDLGAIKGLSLFGSVDAKEAAAATAKNAAQVAMITDAPKTSLSILLTGVVASTAEQRGVAVIESQGSQDTYSPGDKIKGTSASLKEVYADRIIITNSGRYETLMLDGLEFTASVSDANQQLQQSKAAKPLKVDRRGQNIGSDIQESRSEVLADPGKLNDYLAISPVQQDGQLEGYRLNPGTNPELFQNAGFKPNDLAKSINGYDLTDMTQALDVMGQLPELTDISVTVEREGQLVEIVFSLPQ